MARSDNNTGDRVTRPQKSTWKMLPVCFSKAKKLFDRLTLNSDCFGLWFPGKLEDFRAWPPDFFRWFEFLCSRKLEDWIPFFSLTQLSHELFEWEIPRLQPDLDIVGFLGLVFDSTFFHYFALSSKFLIFFRPRLLFIFLLFVCLLLFWIAICNSVNSVECCSARM